MNSIEATMFFFFFLISSIEAAIHQRYDLLFFHSYISYWFFESSAHEFADDNLSEGKNIKKKKKKKKSKTQEKEEAVNLNITPLPMDKIEDKKMSDKSSQIWTLSNGLVIEVLEMGKADSKVAASGKKVSSFESIFK